MRDSDCALAMDDGGPLLRLCAGNPIEVSASIKGPSKKLMYMDSLYTQTTTSLPNHRNEFLENHKDPILPLQFALHIYIIII